MHFRRLFPNGKFPDQNLMPNRRRRKTVVIMHLNDARFVSWVMNLHCRKWCLVTILYPGAPHSSILVSVLLLEARRLKVDCDIVKRKFFAACNSILGNSTHGHEMVRLALQESYCLLILMIETGENSKQNFSTDKIITKFYKFFI